MQRTWLIGALWALVACGGGGGGDETPVDAAMPDTLAPDGRPPTVYRETCDGSGAVAVSQAHFLDVNDENQVARIYTQGQASAPVQSIDLSPTFGAVEADLEDIARVGDRIFITTSHARTASGNLNRARYRLGAFDLAGAPPSLALTPVGSTGQLLDQMLVAGNWDTPNTAVIAALTTSSKLNDNSDPDLAPEIDGTNIEGLANDGTGKLLIGFRNPRPGGKALVVSLVNPDAALTGTARFGTAYEIDLGGLGIRSMTYSPTHAAVLIVAGAHNSGTTFQLYKWTPGGAPALVTAITAPASSAPEAVVAYPGSKDVQIVFDGGDALIGGVGCKDAPVGDRVFSDLIVTVE